MVRNPNRMKYRLYTDLILQKKDLTWALSNRTPAAETMERETLSIPLLF